MAAGQSGGGLRSVRILGLALIASAIAAASTVAWAQDSAGPALRGFVWLDGSGVTRQGRAAIDELLAASSHGLDPDDYNARALDSLARGAGRAPALDLAATDLLLSGSMVEYLRDLHSGRAHLAPFARPPADNVDWAAALGAATAGDSISRLVAASEPHLTQYRNLRVLLQRYRRLASEAPPPLLPVGPAVRPGESYAAADVLRERLERDGDWQGGALAPAQSPTYDDSLSRAVRRFQLRHGLAADGVLGARTVAALNTPFAYRVHQIELALERLRWLPRLGAQPFLVVNIPAFQLFAFDSAGGAGAPSLTMKVVVGKALDTRTPMLLERMRYIEFRPYWNVPRSILTAEILPQLGRHPEYLRSHGMEVVGAEGRALGDSISPEIVRGLSSGKLRVRQKPGPSNALGLIKFAFPNAAGVYMHDTPDTVLFSQARRDFSHGCIRVERPAALAAWLMRDQPEWTLDRIADAMNAPETRRIPLTRPIPVAVYYTTVVAMPDGEARFYPDIYGRDPALSELLHRPPPAPRGVAAAAPVR